jgi:hypothetical protein
MNGKTPEEAIVERLGQEVKRRPSSKALTFSKAAIEIGQALNIDHEAARMTLYGLCATGNVRWVDNQRKLVDEDKCTIADFTGKPNFVSAEDVRDWLTEWSPAPQPSRREAVIDKMIAEGLNPPRNINWKMFYKRVRDECNGWLGDRPAPGFSDKQIQRIYKDLRSK